MKQILLGLLFLLLIPAEGKAQFLAVKANAGSMGLGGEVVFSLNQSFNARFGYNAFKGNLTYTPGEDAEFDFETDIALNNASAVIDLHPFGNSFRISGGIVYNLNEFNATFVPRKTYRMGGDEYSRDELGVVQTDIEFAKYAPYATFGFGNAFTGRSVGFNIDLGVMYQQRPEVTMHADGMFAPTAEQSAQLENNLDWAEFYPVVMMSLYIRLW